MHFILLVVTPQLIHWQIILNNSDSLLISCIYAFDEARYRRELWHDLSNIALNVVEPWVVLGDFNAILHSKDKSRGPPPPLSKLVDFRNCINFYGLYKLPSTGLNYTWSNKQVDTPILAKINRIFFVTFSGLIFFFGFLVSCGSKPLSFHVWKLLGWSPIF